MGVHSAVAKEEIPTPSAQPPEAPGALSLELLQVREQTDQRCMLCAGPCPGQECVVTNRDPLLGHTAKMLANRAQINPTPVSAPKDVRESTAGDLGWVGRAVH